MTQERDERFTTWGGRVLGGLGLALVALVVVLGIPGIGQAYPPVVYACCGLAAVGIWVVLIRPSVAIEGDRLVLRNPVSTSRVPLAAIEQVVVRQWLAVSAGARRFTCSGVSRSMWQARRDDQRGAVTGAEIGKLSYGAIVERRIDKRAEDARARQGVERYSDEQQVLAEEAVTERAWPEIGLLTGFGLAVVVTAFL